MFFISKKWKNDEKKLDKLRYIRYFQCPTKNDEMESHTFTYTQHIKSFEFFFFWKLNEWANK